MTAAAGSSDGTEDADFGDVQRELERSRGSRQRRPRSPGTPRAGGRRGGGAASAGEERIVEGLVCGRSRRNFLVSVCGEELLCYLPGHLLQDERPVVGDTVRVLATEAGEGVLREILPRKNRLRRIAESSKGRVRTVAANIDRLFAVLAARPSPPRWSLADRLLAVCDLESIDATIVINKVDLVDDDAEKWREIEAAARVYRDLGFAVLFTSVVDERGIGELERAMKDRINVFSGHSGVGKSSLLNRIHPGWKLAVATVNPRTSKGRHTTTAARLLGLPFGGHVVDTPGFREFGLGDVEPAELGRCYREFRSVIGGCRFSDCLHEEEPGCALKRAVDRGEISRLRYGNYLQILHGLVSGD